MGSDFQDSSWDTERKYIMVNELHRLSNKSPNGTKGTSTSIQVQHVLYSLSSSYGEKGVTNFNCML
uniref:Uncharacterized protein n=1 Tax=Anguilla anguilla TaxID=7936 RepID=A0A0E9WKU2_ANGAN